MLSGSKAHPWPQTEEITEVPTVGPCAKCFRGLKIPLRTPRALRLEHPYHPEASQGARSVLSSLLAAGLLP